MQTFKHILVPTDFSASSVRAVELATTLATVFNAELTLFHAWEISVYPYMEYVLSSQNLMRSLEKAAGQRLEESLLELKERVPRAESMLKAGVPWQEIVAACKALHADLIVMGTHGRRGINHALLGSVAEKVVRLSTAPVLTVHADLTDRAQPPTPGDASREKES
jgi:nucleotide-binding universal stress UspA family protein